jgi:DNA-binding beta-propeller fold protein YncE
MKLLPISVITALAVIGVSSSPTGAGSASTPAAVGVRQRVEHSTRTGNDFDFAHSLAVAADGRKLVVTGDSGGGMKTNLDYATVAYDPGTGARLWLARYNGPASRADGGESVALSTDGTRVYVTGASVGRKTGYDYGTFAYNAKTEEAVARALQRACKSC